MSGTAGPPALLCTDTVAARFGPQIADAAPGLAVVPLHGDDLVADGDLQRIHVAFFSGDAWPDRAARFMGAVVRAPTLRWLHTFSAGTDNPVFGGLRDRGVRVTSSSGAAAGPVARTALLYLLALSRGLPQLFRAQAAHEWAPHRYDDVAGQTVGVVGMGPIGLEVIRLATAVGMLPIGVRRRVVGDEPCETWALDRLAELACVVDALVLALPLTDDTRGLISADVIARMRADAVLVNVGRGGLLDEVALTEALEAGRLGGAALDVFATEPLPADSPLWNLPNVIVTPHISALTRHTDDAAVEIFLANLAAYAAGDPLLHER